MVVAMLFPFALPGSWSLMPGAQPDQRRRCNSCSHTVNAQLTRTGERLLGPQEDVFGGVTRLEGLGGKLQSVEAQPD